MKLYDALIKKDKNNKIEDIVLLQEGFSFVAFFLSALWFVFHRMWHVAAIVLAVDYSFSILSGLGILSAFDIAFLQTTFLLLIAYNANRLFNEFLHKKGYKTIGLVLANSRAEARIKAMKILHHNYPNLSFDEFSEAIIDPKSYGEALRGQKSQPYFTV